MKRSKILGFLLASSLLISCGGYDSLGVSDEDTPEARRYEILKALDEGNYDYVISTLEKDPTYGGAFSVEEGKLNLAAAYVGKAGFDINDVINSLIDSADVQNQDSFQVFVRALTQNKEARSSLYLKKAQEIYLEIESICDPAPEDPIKRDACFYRGVIEAANAAVSVSTIVEDVDKWLNPEGCQDDINQNGVGDDADITACAIEYAVSYTCSVINTSVRGVDSSLQFTDTNGNTYTYELISITVNSSSTLCSDYSSITDYRLIATENGIRTVAITEGYCDTNFNPCQKLDINAGCYPCPVVDTEKGETLDVIDTIVDTINASDDIINAIVPDNTDVQQAVNEFIQEVCGFDNYCTQEEIANYLLNLSQIPIP